MFNNLKIAHKLTLGFGVIIAMMFISFFVIWINVSKLDRIMTDVFEVRTPQLLRIEEIKLEIFRVSLETRHAMLGRTDADRKEGINSVVEHRAKAIEIMGEFEKEIQTDKGRALFSEIKRTGDEFWKMVDIIAPVILAGKNDEAYDLLIKRIIPARNAMLVAIEAQKMFKKELMEKGQVEAEETDAFIITMLIGAFLISAVLGGMIAYAITRNMTRSMNEAVAVATLVASGDLTGIIEVRSKDEAGQLMHALKVMNTSLTNIIRKVNESAHNVTGTASQLATAAAGITQSSRAQSDVAISTASEVEQMTSSISSVAESASEVRKLSEHSLEKTKEGNKSVSEMVLEIASVKKAMNEIAGSVGDFVKSARTIAVMTKQVKDIAEQTNLLALNAAIEAARAGEQGRGFAVVADEVRKLAEKSAQSAREIDKVTSTLDEQSGGVEKAIEQGLNMLQATQQHVNLVSSMLTDAGTSVTHASSGVSDIAVSVGEQSKVSNTIARHVDDMAKMAKASHTSIENVGLDIERLRGLAGDMQAAVASFKV